MTRRLLKFTNYAAQLMALIDIGKNRGETAEHQGVFPGGGTRDRPIRDQQLRAHPRAIPSRQLQRAALLCDH